MPLSMEKIADNGMIFFDFVSKLKPQQAAFLVSITACL